MQPPATVGPFAGARRAAADSTEAWGTAASTSSRAHAGVEPQRCYSAPLECAENLTRLQPPCASTCSRHGTHSGVQHSSRLHPGASDDAAADRAILRYDSASSELAYLQQERAGSAYHAASSLACSSHPHSGPPDIGFERRSWGSNGSSSSSGTGDGHAAGLMAERWDSAQSEMFEGAVSVQLEGALQEQSLRQRERLRRLQQQRLAATHGAGAAEPASETGGSHQEGQLRESSAMPAADSAECEGEPWGPGARRAAGSHELASEDRVRQPRRRRSAGKPPPRTRRCLSAAFAAAADAQRLQRLDEAPTHFSCPSLPGCCAAACDVQRICSDDLELLGEGTWQPGGLWEVLRGAPGGLTEEAARSVVANVAYALLRMHEDGLVHRHVSACTVVLGETPCFETARLAEGGCTAVLDSTGAFCDAARVGDPQYQAPEVLRAFSDVKIPYTPSGDMWSLGVLLLVLLTKVQPPFERLLGQGAWAGLTVDALQQRVSACLFAVLNAHQPAAPISRSAQALLQALLRVDPAQRATAAEVCGHPWVLGLQPITLSITVDGTSSFGASADGGSVEGTLQAMQRMWLQQPTGPFQGSYGSQVEALGAGDSRTAEESEHGRTGEKAASSAVVSWLQRFLGRCKRPSGKELMAPDDMTALILHHY